MTAGADDADGPFAGSGAIIAILASVLTTAWVLVVGSRLYQLSRR